MCCSSALGLYCALLSNFFPIQCLFYSFDIDIANFVPFCFMFYSAFLTKAIRLIQLTDEHIFGEKVSNLYICQIRQLLAYHCYQLKVVLLFSWNIFLEIIVRVKSIVIRHLLSFFRQICESCCILFYHEIASADYSVASVRLACMQVLCLLLGELLNFKLKTLGQRGVQYRFAFLRVL